MRVEYKNDLPYRETDVIFCCSDMKKAWDEYFIRFGKCEGECCESESKMSGFNKINRVCIYKYTWCYEYMPINYCPFCGSSIKLIEAEA